MPNPGFFSGTSARSFKAWIDSERGQDAAVPGIFVSIFQSSKRGLQRPALVASFLPLMRRFPETISCFRTLLGTLAPALVLIATPAAFAKLPPEVLAQLPAPATRPIDFAA